MEKINVFGNSADSFSIPVKINRVPASLPSNSSISTDDLAQLTFKIIRGNVAALQDLSPRIRRELFDNQEKYSKFFGSASMEVLSSGVRYNLFHYEQMCNGVRSLIIDENGNETLLFNSCEDLNIMLTEFSLMMVNIDHVLEMIGKFYSLLPDTSSLN